MGQKKMYFVRHVSYRRYHSERKCKGRWSIHMKTKRSLHSRPPSGAIIQLQDVRVNIVSWRALPVMYI